MYLFVYVCWECLFMHATAHVWRPKEENTGVSPLVLSCGFQRWNSDMSASQVPSFTEPSGQPLGY